MTGPGMFIAFGGQACLVQIVKNPELWEPAALGEDVSHIRGRIVMAFRPYVRTLREKMGYGLIPSSTWIGRGNKPRYLTLE